MAVLKHHLKGATSTPEAPGVDASWTALTPGPYIGIVKGNKDPARMGRLSVLISSITRTHNPHEHQLITCEYLSPFYGAKPDKYNIPHSRDHAGSQHSYGFWGVPPDLETRVLVIFAEGKTNQAYWIGCIQDPYTNHMVPGIASSENTFDKTTGLDTNNPNEMKNASVDKKSTYGSTNVPSGELNRSAAGALMNNNYDSNAKPIHPFADILVKQGLSADDIRGNTTSSARRESPSQVFGISTPGRKDTTTTKVPVGTKDSGATDYVTRGVGHTFVMDDGDLAGDNQLTRLRTASGHQLLMHDTEGVVYLANGSGEAFIEMTAEGKIHIYSAESLSLRTGGNFNVHSDADIQFHATNDIKFTAENNLNLNAEKYVHVIGDSGILSSSQSGAIKNYGKKGISSYTAGQQLHGASGEFHLQGSKVHFNKPMGRPGSGGGSSISGWGPSWLKPAGIGIKIDKSKNDVEVITDGEYIKPLTTNTKTTVTDLVTHEPFTRKPAFSSGGAKPWEIGGLTGKGPTSWNSLSKNPLAKEFVEHRNRLSSVPAIKYGQYKADLKQYTKSILKNNSNPIKILQTKKTFKENYSNWFKVKPLVTEKSSVVNIIQQGYNVVAGRIVSVRDNITSAIKKFF